MNHFKGRIVILLTLVLIAGGILVANPGDTMKKSKEAAVFEQECQKELKTIRNAFEDLKVLKGVKTVKTVLVPFNELQILIDRSLNRVSVYEQVHPDSGIRDVSEKYVQEFSKVVTEIGLSVEIFNHLKAIDLSKAEADTKFYVNKLLMEYKRSGLDKDAETRKKIAALREEIIKEGQAFGRNIREDVRYIELDSADQLAGLPQDFIDNHKPGKNGKIRITTDYPDFYPFIRYAKSDKLRKAIHLKFNQIASPVNKEVLEKLFALRHKLAGILGYKCWAHYNLEDKMVETPEAAGAFIQKVADIAGTRAKQDYQVLLERLKKEMPDAKEVSSWQSAYISNLVRKEKYQFDNQELRQYFPYESVKNGILDITAKMYGVTFKKVAKPVWHESVDVYEMWEGSELLGRIYLDMHPRENKFKHAQMVYLANGVKGRQIPEGGLICNFPGGDDTPGLMEFSQVSTFFHEMGHMLHFLFSGKQRWIQLSGISAEWDFAETPAILYQEWAWDPAILKTFAKNAKGEVLPDELIKKMWKSRTFGRGLGVRQQMFYAALSLGFHNQLKPGFNHLELVKKYQADYSLFKYIPETHMHLSFGHLVGYEATYYTYMWSEVIALDMMSRFLEKGLMNPEVARLYRDKVLAPGGSKKAADMVKNFLGRSYSFEAFKKYVNQ